MIIGINLIHFLKLDVQFSTVSFEWHEHGSIPLKPSDGTLENHFYINDPEDIMSEAEKMSTILDANYEILTLTKCQSLLLI